MKITLYTNDLSAYLAEDEIIDYNDARIARTAGELSQKSGSETEYIKRAFEYVRDNIPHSTSIGSNTINVSASEVLEARHFTLEDNALVCPVRPEKGEEDGFTVYPDPDLNILAKLKKNKTRKELWDDLPTGLAYLAKK